MESSAAKQQPMAGGSMATAEQAYLRTETGTNAASAFTRLCIRQPPILLFLNC